MECMSMRWKYVFTREMKLVKETRALKLVKEARERRIRRRKTRAAVPLRLCYRYSATLSSSSQKSQSSPADYSHMTMLIAGDSPPTPPEAVLIPSTAWGIDGKKVNTGSSLWSELATPSTLPNHYSILGKDQHCPLRISVCHKTHPTGKQIWIDYHRFIIVVLLRILVLVSLAKLLACSDGMALSQTAH